MVGRSEGLGGLGGLGGSWSVLRFGCFCWIGLLVCVVCLFLGWAVSPVVASGGVPLKRAVLGRVSGRDGRASRRVVRRRLGRHGAGKVSRRRRRSAPRHRARSASGGLAGGSSLVGDSLAGGGLNELTGGEEERASRDAELASPPAVNQRIQSQTAYEGYSSEQAQALAGEKFGALIQQAEGGPPALPVGVRIVGFPSDFGATVELPEGGHGALASVSPMAVQTSSGRVPVDLVPRVQGSSAQGSGFEPITPSSGLHVVAGRNLSEGVSLADVGVSLTPVTAAGGELQADGVVDGASVFYGDSEAPTAGVTDVDSVVKFIPEGFSEDTFLRSSRSPSRLFFRVGMPQGAELVAVGSQAAAVRQAGQTLAIVRAPEAHDAEGSVVPVSMEVMGDTLVVSVQRGEDQYSMPIVVDPTVTDYHLTEVGKYTDWVYGHNGSDFHWSYGENNLSLETDDGPSEKERYSEGQFALLEYPTQKESRVYGFIANTTSSILYKKNLEYTGLEGELYIEDKGKVENLGGRPVGMPLSGEGKTTLCVVEGCAAPSVSGGEANGAFMELYAASPGESETGIELKSSSGVEVVQEKGPSAAVDTSDGSLDGLTNGAHGGHWVKASAAAIGVTALDPGMGIDEFSVSSPQTPGWGHGMEQAGGCEGLQCNECWNYSSRCEAGDSTSGEPFITGLAGLSDGEDTVETKVKDAVGLSATAISVLKIDDTPPHNIVLTGLGPGGQVGDGEYQLKAEATDGSGTTASSGMSSLSLSIDGHEIDWSSASCSPGPCTAHSGTWTIFGHNYATGRHTVTVTATDNAGNTESESFSMIVHQASPVALGPGSFDPQSGEFSLSATDVSMPNGLTVSRSYGSQHLTAGLGGTLGSQWVVGLGGQESLVKQPNGSMVLTGSSGEQTIFAPNGSDGYISPAGDSNLMLSTSPCETGQTEFRLEDANADTTTCFKVPSGGSGEVWAPHITQGAAPTDTVTYSYETVEVPSGSKKMVTRPHEALAPVPAGVGPCAPELKVGCQALTFNYATSTTANGEKWGNVEGDLTHINYTAYEASSKAMKTVEVADYLYDNLGRLRTEWDPRITPEPLKTYYGYDSEGHVTALTPPGQETWTFVYGRTAGGGSSGSVMKATRAPTSASVWSGTDVSNTVMPEVVGSSTTGTRMAVTEGKWSGSPVVYGYQWEDCNASGGECVAIPGATKGLRLSS